MRDSSYCGNAWTFPSWVFPITFAHVCLLYNKLMQTYSVLIGFGKIVENCLNLLRFFMSDFTHSVSMYEKLFQAHIWNSTMFCMYMCLYVCIRMSVLCYCSCTCCCFLDFGAIFELHMNGRIIPTVGWRELFFIWLLYKF